MQNKNKINNWEEQNQKPSASCPRQRVDATSFCFFLWAKSWGGMAGSPTFGVRLRAARCKLGGADTTNYEARFSLHVDS